MKQLIIITILSLSMINCKGQQNDTVKQNNIKKDTMEYFNENKPVVHYELSEIKVVHLIENSKLN